ncbi:MAG: hypothetical protein ACJAYI_000456 [Myxococcota bacterium]|jgi:hypothetical protein
MTWFFPGASLKPDASNRFTGVAGFVDIVGFVVSIMVGVAGCATSRAEDTVPKHPVIKMSTTKERDAIRVRCDAEYMPER